MTDITDARDQRAKSISLKVLGWIWCVLMSLFAISMLSTDRVVPSIAYGISAFLAAPPSWRMLARFGVRAARPTKAVAVIGAWVAAQLLLSATDQSGSRVEAPVHNVAGAEGSGSSTEGPANCEGITSNPNDYAVAKGGPLYRRADAKSGQVKMPFGIDPEPKPVSIDTTMPVREICRSGQWSYIAILQLPSDIGKATGWVPTADLRPVRINTSGRRIYGPSDFEWVDGSLRYQKAILTVAKKVMVDNWGCDAFNSQSILMEKDRAGPLIKLACFGDPEQIIEFRPDDATNGRSFVPEATVATVAPDAPVEPTDERTALAYCQTALRERAAHPSTVEIDSGTFEVGSAGISTYETTFSAKNSFNLTLTYSARCTFRGSDLIDLAIQERTD